MAAYISESIRHYRLAESIMTTLGDKDYSSYAVISQCAFYLEAVINDVIFLWQFNEDNSFPNFKIHDDLKSIDLYNEKLNIKSKLNKIVYPDRQEDDINHDEEYIEFKHLISIRDRLVHLKPTEQGASGESLFRGPKSSLNYLYQKQIIGNPFGKGVFWADVLREDLSCWALELSARMVEYMYEKTYYEPFGIQALRWQCQLLGVGPFRKDR
jgi:hypothetical protein